MTAFGQTYRNEKRKGVFDLRIVEWIIANREIAAIVLGILVNAAGLIYNIVKLARSGGAKDLRNWLRIIEAARQYEVEAESLTGCTAPEKLDYVLTRLRVYAEKLGYPYDEEKFTAQVEADIAFSREVNAEKSETLE